MWLVYSMKINADRPAMVLKAIGFIDHGYMKRRLLYIALCNIDCIKDVHASPPYSFFH